MEPATIKDYVNEVERMIAHYEKAKADLMEGCKKDPLDISLNIVRYLRINEASAVLIALREVRNMFPSA